MNTGMQTSTPSTKTAICGDSRRSHQPSPSCVSAFDVNIFFEHAAHHNADGVVSLQNGDCGRAFHSFVATLTTLNKCRNYHIAQSECMGGAPPMSLPPSRPITTSRSSNKNCKAIPIPYLEDSGFYIYSNAVIFSRKPRLGSDQDGADQEDPKAQYSWQLDTIAYCEAVAQFNLGLAYHQRGKYCGEDQTLLGALELYEQSLNSLKTIEAAADCEETKVLQLAVMNNRIHILNEIARFPSAQLLVNDLLLGSVNALSANEGNALSFLTRADIDNFLLNALVIRRFNTAPCA